MKTKSKIQIVIVAVIACLLAVGVRRGGYKAIKVHAQSQHHPFSITYTEKREPAPELGLETTEPGITESQSSDGTMVMTSTDSAIVTVTLPSQGLTKFANTQNHNVMTFGNGKPAAPRYEGFGCTGFDNLTDKTKTILGFNTVQ